MSETVQSIVDFLNTRASSTPLTQLQVTALVSDLKGRIDQLSITVPHAQADAVTILYSGEIAGGPNASTVAQDLVDSKALRNRGQTAIF